MDIIKTMHTSLKCNVKCVKKITPNECRGEGSEMKLVDMTCPHCGASLKVDPDARECTCEFCNSKFVIDNETIHVKYDNAEESGYQFEKGRQRAQKEAELAQRVNPPQYRNNQVPPKKKLTWLWVLGWIVIFPVPLTILMLRKKEMKKELKYGIIAAGWILYILIAIFGGGTQNEQLTTNTSVPEVITAEESADSMILEGAAETEDDSESEIFFKGDEVINHFIADFNSTYDVQITDIQETNSFKTYGYIGNVYVQLRDSYDAAANNYNMSIFGGNTDEKTEAMFDAFRKVAKVLDKKLADEQIETAIATWKSGDDIIEDTTLGELTITYVPSVEMSYGRNDSRIDVSSATYAKPQQ